ncbi:MAG: hypothetical protein KF752_05890 [Pirellulaceae bacterium]|nr:hypothetical protein [Pirellulaceae bacterium]
MSSAESMNRPQRPDSQLQLPASLRRQMLEFRAYVWSTKLAEAFAAALVALLLAYLTVYFVDRQYDTPLWLRWTVFVVAVLVWLLVPYAAQRWVWRQRRWEQLARLLRRRDAGVGDELLSVIELSASHRELQRSPALCQAAIEQVAERAAGRDLRSAAPQHQLRPLIVAATVALACAIGLLLYYPLAASNAWQRLLQPWRNTARYTFTSLQPLPESLIVAHGEPISLKVKLSERSARVPQVAQVRIGNLPPIVAPLEAASYDFQLAAQTNYVVVRVSAGDDYHDMKLRPKLRPELSSLIASVRLPDYLQRDELQEFDVRSGVVSAVVGSQYQLTGTATAELQSAQFDGLPIDVQGDRLIAPPREVVEEELTVTLSWLDRDGLTGREPLQVQVKPLIDEPPAITVQDLSRQMVVLETEQINFQVLAADDFGIRRIGLSWRGFQQASASETVGGNRIIAAGGPQENALQVTGTFCAQALGIAPQPIELVVWAEDYLPGRPPAQSSSCTLFILTADQHAIWINSQMSKWHRSALDVRDAELQLHQANQRLRQRAATEQDSQQFLEDLRRQAALEQANGRRLSGLNQTGSQLLAQAARNPDISPADLSRWAETLKLLGDIASSRMPAVTELLQQAANQITADQARSGAGQQSETPALEGSQIGAVRAAALGGQSSDDQQSNEQAQQEQPPQLPLPSIVDVESSQQGTMPESENPSEKSDTESSSAGRFGLPQTALIGPTGPPPAEKEGAPQEPPPALDKALDEQLQLLAEFEKISDQLGGLMANLEGSTLVKRLKAASREQLLVAQRLAGQMQNVFGSTSPLAESQLEMLKSLAESEQSSSQELSFIMDDMQAYFDRRRSGEFKTVLEEMKSSEVLVALQKLGNDLLVEHGLSIAQAEYWADTLDRWAEDLVETASGDEESKPSGTSQSLPPAIVLKLLRILEGEVNLREDTRVAQQAMPVVEPVQHQQETQRLAAVQLELRSTTDNVLQEIAALPGAEQSFAGDMQLLATISPVMEEARQLLMLAQTGPQTIAAQTEVIELMLRSQRINPQGGGGGGGSSPGGGGTGTTDQSALALVGAGMNLNERRERRDVDQAVGSGGQRQFPEEFRAGLDAYFQRLESER